MDAALVRVRTRRACRCRIVLVHVRAYNIGIIGDMVHMTSGHARTRTIDKRMCTFGARKGTHHWYTQAHVTPVHAGGDDHFQCHYTPEFSISAQSLVPDLLAE